MPGKKGGVDVKAALEHVSARKIETPMIGGYHDGQYMENLPLDRIQIWAKNPRKIYSPEALVELAATIREHGVMSPITVRVIQGEEQLSIVMGERRYRASKLADRQTIPAIIRVGLDDRAAMELAVIENGRREDLNPIEAALGYKALMQEGATVGEIARSVGVDISTVSNSMRLLKLPQSVQTLLLEGKLMHSHGKAILRFEEYPQVMEAIAEFAAAEGASSRSLEKGVPFAARLQERGLVQQIALDTTEIDVAQYCEKCPFQAWRREDNLFTGVCLKPAHYQELVEAAGRSRSETGAAVETTQRPDTAALLRPLSPSSTDAAQPIPASDRSHVPDGSAEAERAEESVPSASAMVTSTAHPPSQQASVSRPQESASRAGVVATDKRSATQAPPAPASETPRSPFVTCLLPESEYNWLIEEGLTLAVAVAELRAARQETGRAEPANGSGIYKLSEEAEQALAALTGSAIEETGTPRTHQEQLEILVIARARQKGLLKDMWEEADQNKPTEEATPAEAVAVQSQ